MKTILDFPFKALVLMVISVLMLSLASCDKTPLASGGQPDIENPSDDPSDDPSTDPSDDPSTDPSDEPVGLGEIVGYYTSIKINTTLTWHDFFTISLAYTDMQTGETVTVDAVDLDFDYTLPDDELYQNLAENPAEYRQEFTTIDYNFDFLVKAAVKAEEDWDSGVSISGVGRYCLSHDVSAIIVAQHENGQDTLHRWGTPVPANPLRGVDNSGEDFTHELQKPVYQDYTLLKGTYTKPR